MKKKVKIVKNLKEKKDLENVNFEDEFVGRNYQIIEYVSMISFFILITSIISLYNNGISFFKSKIFIFYIFLIISWIFLVYFKIRKEANDFVENKLSLKMDGNISDLSKLMKSEDKINTLVGVIFIRPQKDNEVSYNIFNSFLKTLNPKDITYYLTAISGVSGSMDLSYYGKTNFNNDISKEKNKEVKGKSIMPGFELPGMSDPGNPIAFILPNGNVYLPKEFFLVSEDERSYYLKEIENKLDFRLKVFLDKSKQSIF